MTSYPHEPAERLKQKWLLEEFPSWLQERVMTLLFVQSYLIALFMCSHYFSMCHLPVKHGG